MLHYGNGSPWFGIKFPAVVPDSNIAYYVTKQKLEKLMIQTCPLGMIQMSELHVDVDCYVTRKGSIEKEMSGDLRV